MRDRDFLIWIHARLEREHGESPYVDYMHKLRAIIAATPAEQETPNAVSANSLDELAGILVRLDKRRSEGWLKRLARRVLNEEGASR